MSMTAPMDDTPYKRQERNLVEEARQLKCPTSDETLEEIGPGADLDKWVASVLGCEVYPFSQNWEAVGIGLQMMSERFDYVGLVFFRFKHDFKDGKTVERPEEDWKDEWMMSFMGPLEGYMFCPHEEPKLAFCKGVIGQSYVMEERKKMILEHNKENPIYAQGVVTDVEGK